VLFVEAMDLYMYLLVKPIEDLKVLYVERIRI